MHKAAEILALFGIVGIGVGAYYYGKSKAIQAEQSIVNAGTGTYPDTTKIW